MGLCMGWLGLAMYAQSLGGGGEGEGWTAHPLISHAPLPALALYMFAYSAGAGPLQWVWLGELVPPEYKFFSGIIYAQGAYFFLQRKELKKGDCKCRICSSFEERMAGLDRNFILNVGVCTE